MKTAIILALIYVLVGCGSEEGQNNHGYGWDYTVTGENGLRVRYLAGQTKPSLSEIEKLYRDTMECAQISSGGPLVVFVESLGADIRGITYTDTGTVIIATKINDDASSMEWTHKHEFIHYLLGQSGFDFERNKGHDSPLFLDCTAP